jgi:hypothetical protein
MALLSVTGGQKIFGKPFMAEEAASCVFCPVVGELSE